jgi:hypothetical protein
LRADLLGGYARCVSRTLELKAPVLRIPWFGAPWFGALSLTAFWGCAAPLPAPAGESAGGAGDPAESAPPAAWSPGQIDAVAARWLGAVPPTLGRFQLDPNAAVRAYGADAPASLERACERILGPGCVDGRGLEHVLALRYVDSQRPEGQGRRASLDVVVSRYQDSESAYATFTTDLIGERDPLELSARPLDVPGVAVLDAERVSAWIGPYVIGLSYVNESEPSDRRAALAAAELPDVARRLLAALPAEPDLPLSVQKLPRAQRVPLGARLVPGDALGVLGMGMGAVGYYREGDKRWRVLAIARPDAESARDVLSTLARSPAARRIEKAPLDALAVTERRLPAEPFVGWVVGQRHEVIYGVGDEASVLPEFTPAEREAAVKLSLLDKLVKLTKVHLE